MANWNTEYNSRWKRAFKLKVAIRFGCDAWDKVKCCKCKRRANEKANRIMELHHVYASIEYPELRIDPNNVIPLCNTCHNKFHKRYDLRAGRFTVKVGSAEDLAKYLRLTARLT